MGMGDVEEGRREERVVRMKRPWCACRVWRGGMSGRSLGPVREV
jgi:hypothetical protein